MKDLDSVHIMNNTKIICKCEIFADGSLHCLFQKKKKGSVQLIETNLETDALYEK